jgi:hypothetical protein
MCFKRNLIVKHPFVVSVLPGILCEIYSAVHSCHCDEFFGEGNVVYRAVQRALVLLPRAPGLGHFIHQVNAKDRAFKSDNQSVDRSIETRPEWIFVKSLYQRGWVLLIGLPDFQRFVKSN